LTTCIKTTIIEKISTKNDQTPSQAKDTVETLLKIMKSTLASGEDIMISGFGKFQVNEKAPRKGRNPATGKDMMLKERRIVTFKCSGKLREKLNLNIRRTLCFFAYPIIG
jgi:integration host factor subunit alpha